LFATALVVGSAAAAPTADGFVLGWIADAGGEHSNSLRERLRADPFLHRCCPDFQAAAQV
jgi:hypothetical protein